MKETKSCTIVLTKERYEKIKILSEKAQRTLKNYIEWSISQWLNQSDQVEILLKHEFEEEEKRKNNSQSAPKKSKNPFGDPVDVSEVAK